MRKFVPLGGLGIFVAAGWLLAGPIEPFEPERGFRPIVFAPFQKHTIPVTCRDAERSCVVVYGHGNAPMAIYVYDAFGNCVAHDDVSAGDVFDDLALEWHPPVVGEYDVVLRNLGRKANQAEVAIR